MRYILLSISVLLIKSPSVDYQFTSSSLDTVSGITGLSSATNFSFFVQVIAFSGLGV